MRLPSCTRWVAILLCACGVSSSARAAAAVDGYQIDFPDLPPPVFNTNYTNGANNGGWLIANKYAPVTNVPLVAGGNGLLSLTNFPGSDTTTTFPFNSDGSTYPLSTDQLGQARWFLVRSGFGYVVSGDKPDLYLGDPVPPPKPPNDGDVVDWLTMAATNYSLVVTSTISPNAVFLELSVTNLYAAQGGTMQIRWAFTNNLTHATDSVTNVYTVSSVPRMRPHRIFWTEPPYGAPTVNLSGKSVRFHWTDTFPAPGFTTNLITTRDTNGVVISTTPGQITATNGLFLDSSGFLHAVPGTLGMVVMQYLKPGSQGQQIASSNGIVVIEVAEPVVNTLPAAIGKVLTPAPNPYGHDGLQARITSGLGSSATPAYVYQHKGRYSHSPHDGDVFAVRDSTDAPWSIELYWEEADATGTAWPYERNWYSASWQDAQLYVRGPPSAPGASVFVPPTLNPTLWDYQVPPGHAQLSGNTFTTTLASGFTNGFSLLQFSGADAEGRDNVWFKAVESVTYTSDAVYSRGLDRTPIPWPIGTEITPLKHAYALGFDGVQDWAAVTDRLSGLQSTSLVLESLVRVRQPNDGVLKPILSLTYTNRQSESWAVSLTVATNGCLSASIIINGAAALMEDSTAKGLLADGIWQQVGLQLSETNVTISLDGQQVLLLETTLAQDLTPLDEGDSATLWLGLSVGGTTTDSAGDSVAGSSNYFRGLVDQVQVSSPPGTPLFSWAVNTKFVVENTLSDASGPMGIVNGAQVVAYTDLPGVIDPLDLPGLSADKDYVYDTSLLGRYDPQLYQPASAQNPDPASYVYGVNTGTIEVWWLQALNQRLMPTNVYFPRLPQVYTNVWPQDAPQIVLSSGRGAPPLFVTDPPVIYTQNSPTAPGYNPNEEHALVGLDEGGWVTYALRDDLGTATSSEPYVLAQFIDPTTGIPGMQAYHVVRTNPAFPSFSYAVVVPNPINGPHPLDLLPYTTATQSRKGPAWQDRELGWWAVGAGDGTNFAGGDFLSNTAIIEMQPYYPMQAGFWFPAVAATAQPINGTPIPWLPGDLTPAKPTQGTPVTTYWTSSWPTNAPVMQVGQTLTQPIDNLPNIWDQKSVDVVHQQLGQTGWTRDVVELFDPTLAQPTPLPDPTRLSTGAFTLGELNQPGYVYDVQGRLYFRGLPPDLSNRLYWDPTTTPQSLTLVGSLSATDPPYLLVNALTAEQRQEILNLNPTSSQWTDAVNLLPGTVQSLLPNQPFDHAALAAVGTGAGFVTLAFNNATNPQMGVQAGDPITLSVLQVTNTLYTGSVIPLEDPLNLLSEQMNILFSESFGGLADGFDFDWYESEPNRDGTTPSLPADSATNPSPYSTTSSPTGLTRLLIGGDGATLKEMGNQFFAVRYRATTTAVQNVVGMGYSDFTTPQVAEGWVQRVLNALTPFEQRLRDLSANPVETQGSMIQQAGPPYTGPVALNMAAIDQVGLIQLYTTVMEVAQSLSLTASPPVNDFDVNQQLVLAASRLNALYMVLGNEAYADALDPTLGFGSEASLPSGGLPTVDYGALASSLFCFDNQVPTLLDEELALLRGRGNTTLAPGMNTAPVFNRLFWNFTKGIDGGEVAYAVNYNTHQATNGLITAATAAALYPQGHGDAWGHYLSALRGYLDLLTNSNFEWGVPTVDPMLLDPVAYPFTFDVGYKDEQRIAETAAALTRTGVEIVRRAARKAYTAGPAASAPAFPGSIDDDPGRAWGVVEWAGRAGSLSLYNWALCQSLLAPGTWTQTATNVTGTTTNVTTVPATVFVEDPLGTDRNSVRELDEMVADYRALQQEVDGLDQGLNPLGIAAGAVPFDISPAGVDAGQTHFEQIYQRALVALQNAASAFDAGQDAGRLLRKQSESALRFDEAMNDQESSYNTQLIQLYGYPYADDIGPSGAYPQGYDGPDIFHYAYVDLAEVGFDPTTDIQPMITITNLPVSTDLLLNGGTVSSLSAGTVPGSSIITNKSISLTITRNGLVAKPDTFQGSRRAEGQLQQAYRNYLGALLAYRTGYATWTSGMDQLVSQYDWYHSGFTDSPTHGWYDLRHGIVTEQASNADASIALSALKAFSIPISSIIKSTQTVIDGLSKAIVEGIPKSAIFGTADGGDVTFPARSAILAAGLAADVTSQQLLGALDTGIGIFQAGVDGGAATLSKDMTLADFTVADQAMQSGILNLRRQQSVNTASLFTLINAVNQAQQQFLALQAQGEQLLAERARVRTAAANRMAMGRYNDMAFRIFRNDALRRYGDAFEVAARYTYLAAKAYDYETCLLPSEKANDPGTLFLERVARARTVGRLDNGQPVVGSGVGDPGLADVLARMNANWQVIKGRLGFNNPDTETSYFSLRQELFQILPGAANDERWTQQLESMVCEDLRSHPIFRRYCLPFEAENGLDSPEPGLVIKFPTAINFGFNFFNKPLAGGDSAFDSSHFATKIRGIGVWFSNYDEVVQANPGAQLSRQPRVYLIPVGLDKMRSPTGDGSAVRVWRVVDQAIPVPYPVGAELNSRDWMPIRDALPGPWAQSRRYPSLRAYHDNGFKPEELTYNSRLVGRSAWNDEWYLIIPAGTLGSERQKALNAFLRGRAAVQGPQDIVTPSTGVKDIKLYFQTYSYHGN